MQLKIETISKKYLRDAQKIYYYYIENSYSNFEEKNLSLNSFFNKNRKI